MVGILTVSELKIKQLTPLLTDFFYNLGWIASEKTHDQRKMQKNVVE